MNERQRPSRALEAGRRRLRALHRDTGYLLVGLTLVYAASGLAVNHIDEWDSNYALHEVEVTLDTDAVAALMPNDDAANSNADALPGPDARVIAEVLERHPRASELELERPGDDAEVFTSPQVIEWTQRGQAVVIDLERASARVEHRRPRLLMRVANWLHVARGKPAWTYVADGYALLLMGLALSGTVMNRGRTGLRWRGAVLITLGVAIPAAYVAWSGGPTR